MTTLLHSSNTSQTAEALLNRARRLSSNAYVKSCPPLSFAEGESYRFNTYSTPSSQRSSLNSVLWNPSRRSSLVSVPRRSSSTTPSSLSSSTSPLSLSQLSSSSPHDNLCSTTADISITPTIISSSLENKSILYQNPLQNESPKCNHIIANSDSNTPLNSSPTHSFTCATTQSSLLPSPLTSRPRSLILENTQQIRGSAQYAEGEEKGALNPFSTKDLRRKHLSENGGSLVYGVLAALRQSSEQESSWALNPMGNSADKLDAPSIIPTVTMTSISSVACSSEQENNQAICEAERTSIAGIVAVNDSERPLKSGSLVHTVEHQITPPTSVKDVADAHVSEATVKDEDVIDGSSETASLQEDDVLPGSKTKMAVEPPAQTLSSSSAKSTGVEQEKKEGKGSYLLHKMGMRKNSITEASLSPKDPMSPPSPHLSVLSSNSKRSRRSSRLLGKFVPKFLHTSSSSPTVSPHLQTSSQSSSMATTEESPVLHGHNDAIIYSTVFKGSQESLPLETMAEEDDLTKTSPKSTFLECLRAGAVSPCMSLGRRSSWSSDVSKQSDYSYASRPSDSSMTSIESTTDEESRGSGPRVQSTYAIETKYEQENTKDARDDRDGDNKGDDREKDHTIMATIDSAQEKPPLSPYIIDEDCDDDFFLNSVLRRKSQSTIDPKAESQQSNMVMNSSYPSSTTLSSMHSTPSISGWSNNSSQASSPSPTSPLFSTSQVYPFPPSIGSGTTKTPPTTPPPSMAMAAIYQRTNPLPTPIYSGLDEKRTRLREAVSEWRRSTNLSY
ncbi:hypothetical protein BX616_001400 [Lobosporangium transversale]|uniref:Uncharacterized protein n=1 Tax=Lobosporangium transversale TaxID=64571 RepID=A0A1Y2GKD2_9FUNG|nr:hypothetical protein BCR41DRAFT_355694 [Lobosporangium transversale]KAF9904116.1 hypothetical protein BX616_001400 [Lobosporangium transversale]ORZ13417.1 hypothetical protein BCR41DRAFT_355694 [Lobosporangium transversale]|eukprot:XP_021880498.1 hypothetical protein BCR41DRAFT_355694 [Lobosporangium transversale]